MSTTRENGTGFPAHSGMNPMRYDGADVNVQCFRDAALTACSVNKVINQCGLG